VERFDIEEVLERVREMERRFDALQSAAEDDPAAVWEDDLLQESLRSLTRYYESGQWLRDYEVDEKGLLPRGMKRGVLAQDAVYDLLERINRIPR